MMLFNAITSRYVMNHLSYNTVEWFLPQKEDKRKKNEMCEKHQATKRGQCRGENEQSETSETHIATGLIIITCVCVIM